MRQTTIDALHNKNLPKIFTEESPYQFHLISSNVIHLVINQCKIYHHASWLCNVDAFPNLLKYPYSMSWLINMILLPLCTSSSLVTQPNLRQQCNNVLIKHVGWQLGWEEVYHQWLTDLCLIEKAHMLSVILFIMKH